MPEFNGLNDCQKFFLRSAFGKRNVLFIAPPGSGKSLSSLAMLKLVNKKYPDRKHHMLIISKSKYSEAFIKANKFTRFSLAVVTNQNDIPQLYENELRHDVYFISYTILAKIKDSNKTKDASGRTRDIDSPARNALVKLMQKIDFVVIDEVQLFRNYKTSATQAVRFVTDYMHRRQSYGSDRLFPRIIATTATPVHKNLEDMYHLFEIIQPGIFGRYFDFLNRYCILNDRLVHGKQTVYSSNGSSKISKKMQIREIVGYRNVEELYAKIAPYYLEYKETDFTYHYNLHYYDFTPEEKMEYQQKLKGKGLSLKFQLSLVSLVNGKQRILTKSHTEEVMSLTGQPVVVTQLAIGSQIRYDGEPYQITDIYHQPVTGNHALRVIKTQLEASKSVNKLNLLGSLLRPDRGCAIYFNYKNSLEEVRQYLMTNFRGRRIAVITGETENISGVLASLKPSDFVLLTRVAQASLDLYFDQIVIYECLTNPGPLEQVLGRVARYNSPFRDITVDFIVRRVSVEEYYYERCRIAVSTAKSNIYSKNLPRSETLQDIPDEQLTTSALKEHLLWRLV